MDASLLDCVIDCCSTTELRGIEYVLHLRDLERLPAGRTRNVKENEVALIAASRQTLEELQRCFLYQSRTTSIRPARINHHSEQQNIALCRPQRIELRWLFIYGNAQFRLSRRYGRIVAARGSQKHLDRLVIRRGAFAQGSVLGLRRQRTKQYHKVVASKVASYWHIHGPIRFGGLTLPDSHGWRAAARVPPQVL
jgi:hypothetical protein